MNSAEASERKKPASCQIWHVTCLFRRNAYDWQWHAETPSPRVAARQCVWRPFVVVLGALVCVACVLELFVCSGGRSGMFNDTDVCSLEVLCRPWDNLIRHGATCTVHKVFNAMPIMCGRDR